MQELSILLLKYWVQVPGHLLEVGQPAISECATIAESVADSTSSEVGLSLDDLPRSRQSSFSLLNSPRISLTISMN